MNCTMKKMGMKHSIVMMMMAVSTAHAASKEVSVADVCNLPIGARSLYEKLTIVSNGVSVVLNVPETLVMWHELKMPITITVSNGTENIIPFMRNMPAAQKRQIWIDLGDKEQFIHPPTFGLKYDKQMGVFDMDKWPSDWRLNPSESASWKLDVSDVIDLLDYASDKGASNITARVRLGDSQWASSKTHTFRVVPRSLEYVADTDYWAQYKVAEFEYVVTKRGGFDREWKETKKTPFFVIPIKGKRILLDHTSRELCELQGEELPEFQYNEATGIVTISQPTGKPIRYNVVKTKVETDENLQ